MGTSLTYGGWASESSVATGFSPPTRAGFIGGVVQGNSTTANVSSGVVRWLGLLVAGVALAGCGTGGGLSYERLQHNSKLQDYKAPAFEIAEVASARTPLEDLALIREVLKPAVSDLATTFGVSRQSVYNWINGEPVAEENAVKLQDLAQAADLLAHEGVIVNAALLKRKFAGGRTLMQVAQAGGSARDAALQLIQIHKREQVQRERMASRFVNRAKTPPSADFDLPSANDYS